MNPWVVVVPAGLLETGWAIGLNHSDGFTRLWPSIATVARAALSFWLLGLAMKEIPFGTAYAVSARPMPSGSASERSAPRFWR